MEQKWGERLADLLELPRDVVMDLPRIVITGNKRLVIENHKGIIEYTTNLLRLNTGRGEVRITGDNLALLSILREEVWIEGKILQVEFVDWEG
ncbi:MAG TPA: sporulation protein YqfC [Bacillota bacterium]|nr:sporulation protein YqfC [Bacillota bacterium]